MSNSTTTATVINEASVAKAIKPATLNTYYTGSPTGQMPEYLRERRAFLTGQGRMSIHLGNSELIFAEDNLFVMTQTPEGKKAFSVKDQPQLAEKVFIGLVRAWTLLSRNSVVPETIDGGVRPAGGGPPPPPPPRRRSLYHGHARQCHRAIEQGR